jgi:hypothetical protein
MCLPLCRFSVVASNGRAADSSCCLSSSTSRLSPPGLCAQRRIRDETAQIRLKYTTSHLTHTGSMLLHLSETRTACAIQTQRGCLNPSKIAPYTILQPPWISPLRRAITPTLLHIKPFITINILSYGRIHQYLGHMHQRSYHILKWSSDCIP